MKILIISTLDRGGAANACFRLHMALQNTEVVSNALVLEKSKNYQNTFQFKKKKKNILRIIIKKVANKIIGYYSLEKIFANSQTNFLNKRTKGLEFFSFPNSKYDITKTELYKKADIINLHWVANFLDFESFFKNNTKPVIWTLHDMNPFTGGEHYAELEFGISKEGNPLERQFTDHERKVFNQNLDLKLQALKNCSNLTIVAPSIWLKNQAESSNLFKNRVVYHIPYGLNVEVFKTRDKAFSRDLFDIPLKKRVVLFVADSVENNRKGFVYLKRALEQINDDNMILCSIGRGKPNLDTSIQIKHLGAITDEKTISIIYSLADVFVIPSLMDNLPNTVLESLLCGTPVIGFPIGGIPDMIIDGDNGMLTQTVSVISLADKIQEFFSKGVTLTREQIRTQAITKYNQNIQAEAYIKLYKKVLNKT
ncbi:glycosyltransferase [Olleya aquimaris]|uniref:Glycosyltransferase involved in cell wall biosynthesis n=1 Tax=Olleya aquimaris TaxID=639310 RepID=A0A327RTH7_9FLAO|nr:glycosyltransferase [Olleya aquimaris]RAJ16977.1 glycosyltransferase involved in cell wall biosynthesis [Olleya aquimaris]